MSLQYELSRISNSSQPQQLQFNKFFTSDAYKSLSETDKLVYESLLQNCSAAATAKEKFIEIPEKVSQDVLIALGIPKKAAIFYWDTPGKEE